MVQQSTLVVTSAWQFSKDISEDGQAEILHQIPICATRYSYIMVEALTCTYAYIWITLLMHTNGKIWLP